jgi:hypothetical protein
MRTVLLSCLLAACASAPPPVAPDAEPVLAEAEAMLAAGNHVACRELLGSRDPETFPRRIQDRYELALARAQVGEADLWPAFQTIREFPDRHPHSELRPQIEILEYEIGRDLANSDSGFWIFWSDRRAGRTVLEHLITRYPDNQHLADALRILGEMAFVDGNFPLAQERFRDLIQRRPDSDWAVLAGFRFAMSIVAGVRGAEYDLDQIELATRELGVFLASKPENTDFVAQATAAQSRLLEMQAERHVLIARFYDRIGNSAGRLEHLQRAATEPLAATDYGRRAQTWLDQLQAPRPR